MVAQQITDRLQGLADSAKAEHLSRFFKTGPGQYGEGDAFLGVPVPYTRSVVRDYRKVVNINDVDSLIRSQWHEVRLAGFLLLIEIYLRAKRLRNGSEKAIVDYYLSVLDRGNNWDLVDLVAPYILGDYLIGRPTEQRVLDQLVAMNGYLWRQRVGVVANWMIMRSGDFDSTFRIAEKMLTHKHDLIHKATGWMLREAGKRGALERLKVFLDVYAPQMPRTMLRYSIEKLPEPERQHYLSLRP